MEKAYKAAPLQPQQIKIQLTRIVSSYFALAMVAAWLLSLGCGPVGGGGGAGGGNRQASQSLNRDQSDAAKKLVDGDSKGSSQLKKVTLLLNWYPEPEHGGFYAAQVHGIYEKYGLDVEIRSGGRSLLVPQELMLNRVQFGVANADDVLVARNQDVPMVALMAPIQDGPRCILTRQDSGIDSFEKLANIKLQIDTTRPYVPFLKSKGYLQDHVEIVPYPGVVSHLVAEKNVACQGYNFSEPFMARQQGVEVNELMLSNIGYNPYASLLVTLESTLQSDSELCEKMRLASIEGWQKYLEDFEQTNALILKNNKQGLEKEALDYGVSALKPLCVPEGMDGSEVGRMTPERWEELRDTLVELKIIDADKIELDRVYVQRPAGQQETP